MKENYIINENRKPLLDIENDLIEMSKNVKIINSLKADIEEVINKKSIKKDFSKNDILNIEDKYKQIKKQINKFMNEKNYIYNFIRIEKSSKKNTNENDENENLLEENKMDNAMENIKKMQDEMKNKVNALDEKLKKVELFDFKKNDSLINEINKNEINDTNFINNENKKMQKYKNSILNTKADIYNEETKELEKVSKTIEMIKQGTNDMKLYVESQGNKINYLNDEHKRIQDNIENGIDELYETRTRREKKKSNIIISIICLIFLIIIIIYMIYKKIHS